MSANGKEFRFEKLESDYGVCVCRMEEYQDELLKNKDKRMEIINEVLQVSIFWHPFPYISYFLPAL